MDDAVAMRELEAFADRASDLDGARDRQAAPVAACEQPREVASGHVLHHEIGQAVGIDSLVVDGHDAGVGAEVSHGPRARLVTFTFDHYKGDVAVEGRVVGEVDLFPPALAQERGHGVAAARQGRGQRLGLALFALCAQLPRGHQTGAAGDVVCGIDAEDAVAEVERLPPLPARHRRVEAVEEAVEGAGVARHAPILDDAACEIKHGAPDRRGGTSPRGCGIRPAPDPTPEERDLTRRLPAAALSCALVLAACGAGDPTEAAPAPMVPLVPPPGLLAKSALVIDFDTGAVLYARQPELAIPPASLTKLMTLHLAWRAVEEGHATLDDQVPISVRAWAKNQPPGASLMLLEPGQKVTLFELMKGLALPSGNDAAVAVAEYLADSQADFVRLMNDEARRLGLASTRFADASGLSARNASTAADLARLARAYVLQHPASIESLHSLTEFAYPREENLPQFALGSRPTLTRENHNELIGRLDGVKGLKTGYIVESGYNIALYAERGRMRLLAVILGGPGEGSREGALNRAIDSTSLLSYGFYAWSTFEPALPDPRPVRVYGARGGRVAVAHPRPLVTVPREHAAAVTARYDYASRLRAPVRKGDAVGSVVASLHGREILRAPLLAAQDAPRGSFVRRLWDRTSLLFARR